MHLSCLWTELTAAFPSEFGVPVSSTALRPSSCPLTSRTAYPYLKIYFHEISIVISIDITGHRFFLAVKLLNIARKASVDRPLTGSKCTALVTMRALLLEGVIS